MSRKCRRALRCSSLDAVVAVVININPQLQHRQLDCAGDITLVGVTPVSFGIMSAVIDDARSLICPAFRDIFAPKTASRHVYDDDARQLRIAFAVSGYRDVDWRIALPVSRVPTQRRQLSPEGKMASPLG